GMSEHPMALPEEMHGQLTPYVELMLCLPKTWQIDKTGDKRWNWPMKWLWFLAKYPHKYNTWLYITHTIPNTEDCEPFGPGTLQCCWFVRGPLTVPEAFVEMKYRDRTIAFLALTAIYRGEMEFALSKDMDSLYALDQALASAGITELVQATRPQLPPEDLKRYLGKLPTS
ncbi:MAG TPA: suppressor of fused domain protein, partial [Tepidisphaeraceae bacterium]|nr:suppressor of fused domain protein [Tepidisphaeraceae bacterium]